MRYSKDYRKESKDEAKSNKCRKSAKHVEEYKELLDVLIEEKVVTTSRALEERKGRMGDLHHE